MNHKEEKGLIVFAAGNSERKVEIRRARRRGKRRVKNKIGGRRATIVGTFKALHSVLSEFRMCLKLNRANESEFIEVLLSVRYQCAPHLSNTSLRDESTIYRVYIYQDNPAYEAAELVLPVCQL